MSSIELDYEKFKKRLDKNVSGLSVQEVNQSFLFRRMGMFSDDSGNSLLPRISEGFANVIDFENYNSDGEIGNIPVGNIITTSPSGTGTIVREKMYSRVGYTAYIVEGSKAECYNYVKCMPESARIGGGARSPRAAYRKV